MFENGIKAKSAEESLEVMDIAGLVAQAGYIALILLRNISTKP